MSEVHEKLGTIAFKAGSWYVISSILVKAITVITTPIFTRLMSTNEFGTSSTFTSWYLLIYTFCTLNLNFAIGRAKIDYKHSLDKFIGSMQLLSLCISLILSSCLCLFSNQFAEWMSLKKNMIFLLAIYLIFGPTIEFVQNGYRYQYKYKQNIAIAWYTSITTVVLSILLIIFIDYDKAFLRVIGIVLPTVVLSIFYWIKGLYERKVKINFQYWKYGLLISVPLILHTVCMNVLSQSDRVIINKYCGSGDVGIYSLAYSYGLAISIITNAIADGWLPWFHDAYHERKFDIIKKNTKTVVKLGCYIGLACIALAPEAILIMGGKAYLSGIYCVPPIVLGVICQYIYTHYVNIEMHLKKTKYVSIGTIIAALLNIILNILFVPKYGYVAASYTTLISYIVLMGIHYFITHKILAVKIYDDKYMIKALFGTSIVGIVISLLYEYSFLRYIAIIVGLISFFYNFREFIKKKKV